jgi:catechol 2,3-dioxygenase-like lactoylglutathione lyase family enzyme
MPTKATEVMRNLHCNYNCVDLDGLERWYNELFSLRTVMASESRGGDASSFGLFGPSSSNVKFLYDHRGARRTTSLELVEWLAPATWGVPYEHPWDWGLQSVGFAVPDLDAVADKVASLGGSIVRRGERTLLLRDPEGVNVEVFVDAIESGEQRYLRMVCSDLERTADWWGALGYTESASPIAAPGGEFWEGDDEHQIVAERALVGADDPSFAMLLTTWSGPVPVGATYGMPFHEGLYRIALAVENVDQAFDDLRAAGLAIQPPAHHDLKGTPIKEGLTILFIRDPDKVLIELVERPRSFFRT